MTNIKFCKLISYVTVMCGYKLHDADISNIRDLVQEIQPTTEQPPIQHYSANVPLKDIEKMFEFIKSGQKISAIKELRNMTGCGLLEGKNTIEILYGVSPQ